MSIVNLEIESKRNELHDCINKFGLNNIRTRTVQEELEIMILKEQIKINNLSVKEK